MALIWLTTAVMSYPPSDTFDLPVAVAISLGKMF